MNHGISKGIIQYTKDPYQYEDDQKDKNFKK